MTISKRLSRTSHQAYKKVTCIKWEKPLAKKYCQITSYMLYCVIKQLAPFVKALKTLYSMEYQVWNENDLVCSVYERIYYYLLFTVHAVDNSKTFWNGQITVYHFECIQNWCHQNWKLDMDKFVFHMAMTAIRASVVTSNLHETTLCCFEKISFKVY